MSSHLEAALPPPSIFRFIALASLSIKTEQAAPPPPPPAPRRYTSVSSIATVAVLAVAFAVLMPFSTPGFLARLTRSFTGPIKMGISPSDAVSPAAPAAIPDGAQRATVAAGCFWGVEHIYRKHFGGKGLYDARVGYIGGDASNPSYRAVCSGETGHAEATQLVFDPTKISYRQLIEFFYRMHDPTTPNQQGNDRGTQYRSGIFYHDAEQERVAREVTRAGNEQWYAGKVVTEIIAAGQWWDAEEYHQLYLDKNPFGYQCASHYVREFPDLK